MKIVIIFIFFPLPYNEQRDAMFVISIQAGRSNGSVSVLTASLVKLIILMWCVK